MKEWMSMIPLNLLVYTIIIFRIILPATAAVYFNLPVWISFKDLLRKIDVGKNTLWSLLIKLPIAFKHAVLIW